MIDIEKCRRGKGSEGREMGRDYGGGRVEEG